MEKHQNGKLSYKDIVDHFKILPDRLNIAVDLAAIDCVLQEHHVEADPDACSKLLDIAYTLLQQKLMDANAFAKARRKTKIDVEDVEMTKEDNEMFHGHIPSRVNPLDPVAEARRTYFLPPMRNCLMGTKVELTSEPSKLSTWHNS